MARKPSVKKEKDIVGIVKKESKAKKSYACAYMPLTKEVGKPA